MVIDNTYVPSFFHEIINNKVGGERKREREEKDNKKEKRDEKRKKYVQREKRDKKREKHVKRGRERKKRKKTIKERITYNGFYSNNRIIE